MAKQQADAVRADVERFVGRRLGPYNSFNAVNRAQIWQWCSAMDDRNPLYLDDAGKPALAPPAMMQMWTMRDCHLRYAPGSTDAHPFEVLTVLADHGFGANVAVSYDLEFLHYLQEGDRAHHFSTIAAISELKQTALGEGYFVTEHADYRDQDNVTFARATISYFAYRPVEQQASGGAAGTQSDAPTPADPPAIGPAAVNRGPVPADLAIGTPLPELHIPITATSIVAGAIASQDFTNVHHDYAAARAAGMPDIFMNILTTCGLSARYVTDWSGPQSRLLGLKFRLFAPNVPGDTMRYSGAVSAMDRQDGGRVVDVAFKGSNRLGQHVAGSARVALDG